MYTADGTHYPPSEEELAQLDKLRYMRLLERYIDDRANYTELTNAELVAFAPEWFNRVMRPVCPITLDTVAFDLDELISETPAAAYSSPIERELIWILNLPGDFPLKAAIRDFGNLYKTLRSEGATLDVVNFTLKEEIVTRGLRDYLVPMLFLFESKNWLKGIEKDEAMLTGFLAGFLNPGHYQAAAFDTPAIRSYMNLTAMAAAGEMVTVPARELKQLIDQITTMSESALARYRAN